MVTDGSVRTEMYGNWKYICGNYYVYFSKGKTKKINIFPVQVFNEGLNIYIVHKTNANFLRRKCFAKETIWL